MRPEDVSLVRKLYEENLDVAFIIAKARENRVFQLVYNNIRNHCPEMIPAPQAAELWNEFHDNAQKQVLLTNELLRLVAIFEQNGIKAIPFKGAALATAVYGNLALRQFGDLDILIPKEKMMAAESILLAQGYERPGETSTFQDLTNHFMPHFMESPQSQRVITFTRGQNIVEVHWDFTPRRLRVTWDLERVRSRSFLMPLNGQRVWSLSPSDRLLALSLHGAKHYWDRLCFVCDIAEVVRAHDDISWKELIDEAASAGCRRILFLALLIAEAVFDVTLPAEAANASKADPVAVKMAAMASRHLMDEIGSQGPPIVMSAAHLVNANQDPWASRLNTYAFSMQVRERLRDRIGYLFSLLVTPTHEDWEMLRLPLPLSRLYYVLRPLRLICVRTARVMRLAKRHTGH